MSHALREHTADVAVEAAGDDLAETFAAVADGLTEAHCESVPSDAGKRFSVSVESESRPSLLFDYLDELIYQRDIRSVLPAAHEVTVRETAEGWHLDATARGVPIEAVAAREIKAVTYSEMDLSETDSGWHAYVVFDV